LLGIDTDTDSYIHHAQPVLRNAARERAARPVDDVRSVLPGQLLQDIREVYALVKRTVVGQTQDQESEERRARNREMFLEWNRARALNENNLANEEREATAQRLVGRTDQQPLRGAQVPPATDEPLRREVGALGGVQRHVTFRDNDSVYEIPPRGALESHSQEEEQTSSGAQDGEMQSPHVTGDDTVPSSKKVTETIWEGILFTLGGAGKAILQGLKIFVTPFQWFYNACRGRTKSEVAPPTQSEGRVVENSRAQGVADEAKIVTEATSHSVQSETIQGQSKS
jgi:hypothetical protein